MIKPLVSVLVPCYNHAMYLDDFFNSLINQTYPNIELILADDCSNDASVEIISSWKKRLENKLANVDLTFREKNLGIIENLNGLLAKANGEYVKVIASDDMLKPEYFEKTIELMQKRKEISVCYTDGFIISDNTKYKDLKNASNFKLFSQEHSQIGVQGNVFEKLAKDGCFIYAPSVIFKKEVYEIFGVYDKSFKWEDYEYLLRVSKRSFFGYIDVPLVAYRLSSNSATRSENIEKSEERILMMEENNLLCFKKHCSNLSKNTIEEIYQNQYIRLFSYSISIKSEKLTKKYLGYINKKYLYENNKKIIIKYYLYKMGLLSFIQKIKK